MSEVADRIERDRDALSPAERQVAEVVLRDPAAVAFGTVAEVAGRSGTSGASVVRLATRLGYAGFSALQAAVQGDIGTQLRPAAERIRTEPGDDAVARTLRAELDNVHRTLSGLDPAAFARAVDLLADEARPVRVLAGEAAAGVGAMLASLLGMLRRDVRQVAGSDVAVVRELAGASPDRRAGGGADRGAHRGAAAVVVAIDLRRYERWVVTHATRAATEGAQLVAVTDSPLSPLAGPATVWFAVAAAGAGPFDSHVGTLALAQALVTGVAGRLRPSATARLDRLEERWQQAGALVDP